MRYNTGNPVEPDGSSSPFDLHDNAGNLDLHVNGESPTWPDRRGRTRKSLVGMEGEFQAAQDGRQAAFDQSQVDKEDRFQQSLLSSGYQDIGDYTAGFLITGRNQVFRKDGEFYRASAATELPYTTTGDWATESSKFVTVGDAALRQELATAEGSSLVGFVQSGLGSIPRTLLEKGRDNVSIMDFGAVGDGTYHPLSERYSSLSLAQTHYPFVTSLAQSIDWAAGQAALNTGALVTAPGRKFVLTDGFRFVSGGGLIGAGAPMWTGGYSDFVRDDTGTHFLMYGAGQKAYSLKHISRCVNSGGVWANPSASEAHYAAANSPAPTYELHDFTNQDAAGASSASVKPFSAAMYIPEDGNVTLRDFRVVPYFNGQEGYKSIYETGLGAEWDVGIYMLNSEGSNLHSVQSVGYWRVAGLLKASAIGSDGNPANSERDNFYFCRFQGHKGFQVRGYDMHRVVAVTTTTISIKWYASHTFEATGTVRAGGRDIPYTALSYDAVNAYLVFTVGDSTGVSVGGSLVAFNGNFGVSGTQVAFCSIYDLFHHSRMVSNNIAIGFATPGKCIEMSGEPARAVQFWGCTVQGRDDIMVQQLHSRDSEWFGTYFESQPAFGSVFSGTYTYPLPSGARWIGVSESTTSAPYPSGVTSNMRMVGCTPSSNPTIDTRPSSPLGKPNRFTAGADLGLFKPREVMDDRYSEFMAGTTLQVRSAGDVRIAPDGGVVQLGGNGLADYYLYCLGNSLNITAGTRHRFSTGAPGAETQQYLMDSSKFSPVAAGKELGGASSANTWAKSYVVARYFNATLVDTYGTGSPEGAVSAPVGSTYRRTSGGANTSFYVKESGNGNTGWVAK